MMNRKTKMPTPTFFLLLLFPIFIQNVACCNTVERDSLLSFQRSISSSPPLNWTQSTDCCQWQGIHCRSHNGIIARVTRLWLPEKRLSGTISPSLANLSFLSHLNLSHNHLTGPLPLPLLHSSSHLQTLDLSFNSLTGPLPPLPVSIKTLDLSSNRFNGTFLDTKLSNLISFNISNNTFVGPINPTSICKNSQLVRILDFSMNKFFGEISLGFNSCHNLQVLRAGLNSLSGSLPYDLYTLKTLKELSLPKNQLSGPINTTIVMLSNLTILELYYNELTGELPQDIGSLSNLEKLLLHANSLTGSLPPSLMNCSNLVAIVLRDNHFEGEIFPLNFSKLKSLQTLDLGSNNFTGDIPQTLCSCTYLTAVRFSHNQLVGEIPPCMSSLKSLQHFAVANNFFFNVLGAFKALRHCEKLVVLIMFDCFHDEMMPNDNDLSQTNGFQNLQIFTLGGCQLKGQIPSWMAKLRKLKLFHLAKNRISGEVPGWLGDMPSLFDLNLTHNMLTGKLPPELSRMPALTSGNATPDLSYLRLPLLIDGNQYNRFYNLRRGLEVGCNDLSGSIPEEIGELKLLQVLDLSNNNFSGGIPSRLSGLTNLEMLNMSGNHLSGKIPESLKGLHFLSSFSVADNDLEGEIPRGGQFDTFPADSFEGNPRICGYVVNRSCEVVNGIEKSYDEEKHGKISWYRLPFGLGFFVGLVAVAIASCLKTI